MKLNNSKRGDAGGWGISMGVAAALIMSALFMVGCIGDVSSNPLLRTKNFDNSDKLDSFYSFLESVQNPEKPELVNYFMATSNRDLFLFFSKGIGPITLKYQGVNTEKNGDFIFQRPEVEVCRDKACLCYSLNAKFWNEIEDEPYIRISNLKKDIPWKDDMMLCIQAPNTNSIFTNSRGLDETFISEAKSNPISLEIPVTLQSEVKWTIDYIFGYEEKVISGDPRDIDSAKSSESKAIPKKDTFLLNEYVWDGGVVIGGIGDVLTKKDKKNKVLSVPFYNITFEHVPKTNIFGVCINQKCLYEKAISKANLNQEEIVSSEGLKDSFNALKNYLESEDFTNCLKDSEIQTCADTIQSLLVKSLDSGESNHYVYIKQTGVTASNLELKEEDIVISKALAPQSLTIVTGELLEEITFIASENNKLKSLDEEGLYVLKATRENNEIIFNFVKG